MVFDTDRLNEWAAKQRNRYISNTLPKDYLTRLRNLGFDFLPVNEHGFYDNFRNLQQYHAANGDCDVPADYEEDRVLARWVEIQVRDNSYAATAFFILSSAKNHTKQRNDPNNSKA